MHPSRNYKHMSISLLLSTLHAPLAWSVLFMFGPDQGGILTIIDSLSEIEKEGTEGTEGTQQHKQRKRERGKQLGLMMVLSGDLP